MRKIFKDESRRNTDYILAQAGEIHTPVLSHVFRALAGTKRAKAARAFDVVDDARRRAQAIAIVLTCLLIACPAFADRWWTPPAGWGQQPELPPAPSPAEIERMRQEKWEARIRAQEESQLAEERIRQEVREKYKKERADQQKLLQQQQMAQMATAEREQKRAHIQCVLDGVGDYAYRKYSDGTIAYLGLVLYKRDGFITEHHASQAVLDKMLAIDAGYRVEYATDAGCRILPLNQVCYNDCFVVGLDGKTGQRSDGIMMLRRIGDYTYETVGGTSRTIPKYELGEQSTKEEYDYFFWKK